MWKLLDFIQSDHERRVVITLLASDARHTVTGAHLVRVKGLAEGPDWALQNWSVVLLVWIETLYTFHFKLQICPVILFIYVFCCRASEFALLLVLLSCFWFVCSVFPFSVLLVSLLSSCFCCSGFALMYFWGLFACCGFDLVWLTCRLV